MVFGDFSGVDSHFFPKLAQERGKITQSTRSRFGCPPVAHVYVFNEKFLNGETKCQI
jgi:hypothetical protein